MNKYEAELVCNEPIGNGFMCAAEDVAIVGWSGDLLSKDKLQEAINDAKTTTKRCFKCFSQKWLVKNFSPLLYQSKKKQWHR